MTAPLVPLALAFAAGVWLGLLVTAPPGWLVAAAAVLLGLAVAARRRGELTAASGALLAVVLLAGWARVALPDPLPPLAGLRGGPTRLEGRVATEPEFEGPRTRLSLWLEAAVDEAGRRPARGTLTVLLYGPVPPLAPADRIAVAVELTVARPLRNPGAGLAAGAERAGPHFVAVGRGGGVERLPESGAPWWLVVRAWVHRAVQRHLPPVSGALFEGLLIGERRQLPPTLVADFRAAGVFHILAISGFNVGLVAGAVLLLIRLLRLPAPLAAALALATLLAFAAVVGGQASVVRATVMVGLVLVGQLLGREAGAWNSLAAALLLLVGWDPNALGDAGFQLSFAATAGILALAPPLRRALPVRWPGALATAVAVSGGAQLAVTPFMLFHWNQLSLIGVAANLVVVPLASALTTLGLVAVGLGGAADGLAHALFQSLWLLLLGLRVVVRAFAGVPGAVVHAPTPPPLALVAAALALLVLARATTRSRRLLATVLAALAGLGTAAGYLPDGRLHLLVLDVGQGDAILIRGPDGRAVLVDTGGGGPGRSDRGERVVLPALRRAGVWRLDALVLTHRDPDHAGGLPGLVEGIPIDVAWVPAGSEEADWQTPLVARGIPIRGLARGDRVWVGPVCVTVLHPPAGWGSDANDGSLVLRIEWGLAAMLLAADADAAAERSVIMEGTARAASVLKVAHHGSRFGSSAPFLRTVAPRVAVISVGARNPFGHPTPAVLARLDATGASIYRTDYDGAVEVTSDGERLSVRRWARPGLTDEWPLRGAP